MLKKPPIATVAYCLVGLLWGVFFGLVFSKEIRFGMTGFIAWATEDASVAQKARTQIETSAVPKAGDNVFPAAYSNMFGRRAWPRGDIIESTTGRASVCTIAEGTNLVVIGSKENRVLLMVNKEVWGGCAKNDEILVDAEEVTRWQEAQKAQLKRNEEASSARARDLALIRAIKAESTVR